MSLSQVQIIRSLGEALAWFEKELAWGVNPAELGHLTGRIGELYAAMITRGEMALAVNQPGYDVVGRDGERISVKTITSSTHVKFRKSSFHHVDRILILRINSEEGEASIEELLDCPAGRIHEVTSDGPADHVYRVGKSRGPARPLADMVVVAEAVFEASRIVQYENGTVVVYRDGAAEPVAMTVLRDIAARIGVSVLNGNGNAMNTRQLGAVVVAALIARRSSYVPDAVAK